MSILQKLTEGVQSRDLRAEGAALLNKWEATGLLEGLNEGSAKQGMAVLLENQAKELLREASSMSAGDVEGFAAVAFPIVRRVFGGLIANELVSVQPMSLPSGLIFFLDFTHSNEKGGAAADASVYGGNRVGQEITGGVDLSDQVGGDAGAGGHYNLGHAHSAPTGSIVTDNAQTMTVAGKTVATLSEAEKAMIDYDADILAIETAAQITVFDITHATELAAIVAANCDLGNLSSLKVTNGINASDTHVRRLTKALYNAAGALTGIRLVVIDADGAVTDYTNTNLTLEFAQVDEFTNGSGLGAVAGSDPWGLEGARDVVGAFDGLQKDVMSEIDIKVDSIAVTAQTRKLKAKWTPELGQDLNAYHNLDA
ncbi:MAG: hypothetical protein VX704_09605, partial [Verrucomicrobiota bacterium]|nr:hypothetical protein [Verrucomicrobiota bacterium]